VKAYPYISPRRLQELVTMLSEKKLFSSVFCCELMKLCKEGFAGKTK
jgi:hypothetical protein